MFGATLGKQRKQRFRVRCQVVTCQFSFFFNLVEKNSFTVKKISKCRENSIDRLRKGNAQRRSRSRSHNQKRRTIRSSENQTRLRRENSIVGVASRSGRINQRQCSTPGFTIGWFFRFSFRLRQPSFHWIISYGIVNGIGRNGNVLILPTPIPSSF